MRLATEILEATTFKPADIKMRIKKFKIKQKSKNVSAYSKWNACPVPSGVYIQGHSLARQMAYAPISNPDLVLKTSKIRYFYMYQL